MPWFRCVVWCTQVLYIVALKATCFGPFGHFGRLGQLGQFGRLGSKEKKSKILVEYRNFVGRGFISYHEEHTHSFCSL